MKKFLVIIMLLPLMVLAQNPTEIPRPPEVPSDYIDDIILYDTPPGAFYDFDGDGNKDICIAYGKSSATPRYYFQFYSYSKKQTIATIPIESTYDDCKFEDFDGDNVTEMIISVMGTDYKNLIYEITSTIGIKKKLP